MHLTDATTAPDNCWIVTATDDEIYEEDSQFFTLTLALGNPTSPGIVLTDPSTATITVMDDEGLFCKLLQTHYLLQARNHRYGPRQSFRFYIGRANIKAKLAWDRG